MRGWIRAAQKGSSFSSPPFPLIPLLAAQTVLGSMLPLLPGLILAPSGWAAGWLCCRAGKVAAPRLPGCLRLAAPLGLRRVVG